MLNEVLENTERFMSSVRKTKRKEKSTLLLFWILQHSRSFQNN